MRPYLNHRLQETHDADVYLIHLTKEFSRAVVVAKH
jgi:hypothetical protein